jgi:hypothetical protein
VTWGHVRPSLMRSIVAPQTLYILAILLDVWPFARKLFREIPNKYGTVY